MQGGTTCRSSAGDWGTALRRRASHLRHHDLATRQPLQACRQTIAFSRAKIFFLRPESAAILIASQPVSEAHRCCCMTTQGAVPYHIRLSRCLKGL